MSPRRVARSRVVELARAVKALEGESRRQVQRWNDRSVLDVGCDRRADRARRKIRRANDFSSSRRLLCQSWHWRGRVQELEVVYLFTASDMNGAIWSLSFKKESCPCTELNSMRFAFDLWSCEDVRTHAESVLARLRNGSMPCDGAWEAGWVAAFQQWVDTGMAE